MVSIDEFLSHLQVEGKHGQYQLLPPALVDQYPQLRQLPYHNIRLDDKRYDYFSRKLVLDHQKVTDIGANIGYFSFRLMTEKSCRVIVYEPFQAHATIIEEIQALLAIHPEQLKVKKQGVSLDNIDEIEPSEVVLFFNVLQHAGEDFDAHYVKSSADWHAYAVEYLKRLRAKASFMVFQTGYSWLGHREDFCPKEEIIPFTVDLLSKAGWEIEHCGVIKRFDRPEYVDFDFKKQHKHPVLGRLRYLEYGLRYRLGYDLPNYRFIQRPVFICRS